MKNIITTKFSAVVVAVLLLTSFAVLFPPIALESFTASADEVTIMSPAPFLSGFGLDPDEIESIIAKIGGTIMLRLADQNGIDEIMGKDLTQGIFPECDEEGNEIVEILAADNPVITEDCFSEFNPSIAAKPNSQNILVAVAEVLDLDPEEDNSAETVCRAYVSTDGGENWSDGISLPLPNGVDNCVHPVVRWAPADGTDSDKNIRVYAAYVALHEEEDDGEPLTTSDIVVSFSNNDGKTWSTPVTAIAGYSGNGEQEMLFDPWIATHINFPGAPGTGNVNDKVYVTATRMEVESDAPVDCTMEILFKRSTNGGATFTDEEILATETSDLCDPTLGLSGPAGGKITSTFSNVLVCWYFSEDDEDGPDFLVGDFDIRCKRSGNFGVDFSIDEAIAVNDRATELPFSKCPVNADGVGVFELDWWKGMRPSLEITRNGVAHIVYAADPNADSFDDPGECGDIYYTRGVNKAYKKWTPTLLQPKLNDDEEGKAQGFPTITSKTVIGKIDAILVAAWVDSRHSVGIGCSVPDGPDDGEDADEIETNCTYDIFYAYTDASWSDHANRRVTDVSSLSSIGQVMEYMDSTAHKVLTTPGNAFLIWTDRSDQGDTEIEDTVFLGTAKEDEDVYEDMVNLPP